MIINLKDQKYFEPCWRSYRCSYHSHLSKGLADWLLEKGSLTERLKNASSTFRVQLLSQVWRMSFKSERKVLGLKTYDFTFVREVKLFCDDKPWVFARTIMPNTTLTGRERQLITLGTTPLGNYLFKDPLTTRGKFELAEIKKGDYFYERATEGAKEFDFDLWGRRSIFYLSQKPILVTEIFTPWFPGYRPE